MLAAAYTRLQFLRSLSAERDDMLTIRSHLEARGSVRKVAS